MEDKVDAITNEPPPKNALEWHEKFLCVRFFKRAASATHCQIIE